MQDHSVMLNQDKAQILRHAVGAKHKQLAISETSRSK